MGARQIAASLDLRALPADFYANPYAVYDLLREPDPVRRMPDGSHFLTRHADLVAVLSIDPMFRRSVQGLQQLLRRR